MSFSVGTTIEGGEVEVIATSGRGLNPDELTRMVLPKLIYIGPDVPADVRAYMDRVCALPGVKAWTDDALAEQDFIDFEEPFRLHR